MAWPARKGPSAKMSFLVDPAKGSLPLVNELYEKAIQHIIKNPSQSYAQIADSLGYKSAWIYKLLNTHDVQARYNFLMQKSAEKAIVTRDYVIRGLYKEHQEAQKSSDRLRALELLGKTLALYTDKHQITGLPKRLVIRTKTAVEEITPDVSTNTN
jgi:hypothetical protein